MNSIRNAALVCGLVWMATSCGKLKETAAQNTGAPKPEAPAAVAQPGVVTLDADAPELRQMSVEPVGAVPMPGETVTATARIEANPNRIGRAMLPAPGRVARVMVKLGDSVVQGQPLLTIESTAVAEGESAYRQAEGAVQQAELTAAKADADLSRLTDLFEHSAVAQKEVLAAKTAAAVARSGVEQAHSAQEQARRRLELLGLKPGKFEQTVTVQAPLSGKVLEVNVVEGEFRNEIGAPVMTIADLRRVWATSEVPESKIRYCKVGGSADLELIAYPNEVFRGHVTRIADTVNGETRTVKVSTELENGAGRLRPDMFGQLRYTDGQAVLPWLPASAVVRIGDKDFVFVEQARGRFLATTVELGQAHNGGFAVARGVKVGDRVVTQGSVYLKGSL